MAIILGHSQNTIYEVSDQKPSITSLTCLVIMSSVILVKNMPNHYLAKLDTQKLFQNKLFLLTCFTVISPDLILTES